MSKNIKILCFMFVLLLSGCVGVSSVPLKAEDKSSIKNVFVGKTTNNNSEIIFVGPNESIAFGVGGGALAENLRTTSSKEAIEKMLKNMEINQIFTISFIGELEKQNKINVTNDKNTSDAVFEFEIVIYGLTQTQGFSTILYPTMGVNAYLKNKNGKVIWQRYEYITPHNDENTMGYDSETIIKDPNKLNNSFKNASNILSKIFIGEL